MNTDVDRYGRVPVSVSHCGSHIILAHEGVFVEFRQRVTALPQSAQPLALQNAAGWLLHFPAAHMVIVNTLDQ